MTETNYIVIDDFKARQIYKGVEFYRAGGSHTDIKLKQFRADNNQHLWREDILEFVDLKTKVTLRFYSEPSEIPKQGLPKHTLLITIKGERKAREGSIRKIEGITGITNISGYKFGS